MCARAVRHTFFQMFKDGLIFRGKRLVNWDTFLQTAVTDDEVYHETVKGHFWHFRYPVIDPQARRADARRRSPPRAPKRCSATPPWPCIPIRPQRSIRSKRELREKLAAAPAKEKADIQAQIDDFAERRQTMLPQLLKLRDMAARRPQADAAAGESRDSADRRRVGQARARHRLREDHAGPRPQRLRRLAAPQGNRRDQHHESRRHAQRQPCPKNTAA